MGRLSSEAQAKAIATRRRNQTHCKYGHEFTDDNTYWFHNKKTGWMIRHCRACIARRQGAVRSTRAAGQSLPVPFGMTRFQVRAILAAQTTRERYGHTTGNRDLTAAFKARSQRQRATHCRRGHKYGPWKARGDGRLARHCETCARLRTGKRPLFVESNGARISIATHDDYYLAQYARLRAFMLKAHPDKGGAHATFIKGQKALARFVEQERKWYAAMNLELPSTKRQPRAKAA